MKNTYALLVGINDYPAPIPTLGGCVKDVDRIEDYLVRQAKRQGAAAVPSTTALADGKLKVNHYGPLQICRLTNAQATYHNIIRGFRDFLSQAGSEDIVWFHFSGHGSEEFTAEELLAIEPNGKDQTLVCYYQQPEDGHQHLADKELAVLLHEVAGGEDRNASPHVLVSLDCCHSGSGTRDASLEATLKTRQYDGIRAMNRTEAVRAGKIRSLDTYLDGFYQQQYQQDSRFAVPIAPHVLLSACESIQLAGDQSAGGIFTSGLLVALDQAQGNLNYSDLFVRTRAAVLRQMKDQMREQTPQFEIIGNFDPYTRFLTGDALGTPDRYELVLEQNRWLVKCGAIHGLPVSPKRPIDLEIYGTHSEDKPVATARLQAIGAQKSGLLLSDDVMLDPTKDYYAILRFLPAPPAHVRLRGEASAVAGLKEKWDASKNIQLFEDKESATVGDPDLEVVAEAGAYRITNLRRDHLAWQVSQQEVSPSVIVDTLGKIVRWERTLRLDHPQSAIKDWARLELGIIDKSNRTTHYSESELHLTLRPDQYFAKDGNLILGVIPRVVITHTEQQLYGYLFHLRMNYSIESYEGEVVFRPDEHPDQTEVSIPLWKKPKGWGLSPDEKETTSYFKLLLTTEPLDYHQLLQEGIGPMRDLVFDWNPIGVTEDWCSLLIKVNLQRG